MILRTDSRATTNSGILHVVYQETSVVVERFEEVDADRVKPRLMYPRLLATASSLTDTRVSPAISTD